MTPKQKEISELCGKPFWGVVRELAESGMSFIEVCRKLGYSKSGLRNTMKRDGMSGIFEMVARSDVIGRVEARYGRPFWEVVKSYADDGESMSATARILGYSNPCSFVKMVRRHGYENLFAKTEKPKSVSIMLDGCIDTIAGHCRRTGARESTVRKRIANGMSVKEAFYCSEVKK